MSKEINLDLTRQQEYFNELERCVKEDCDFYLEHDEVYEFYNHISDLQERIKKAIEYINENMVREDNGCGLWWYQLGDYETPEKLLDILMGK